MLKSHGLGTIWLAGLTGTFHKCPANFPDVAQVLSWLEPLAKLISQELDLNSQGALVPSSQHLSPLQCLEHSRCPIHHRVSNIYQWRQKWETLEVTAPQSQDKRLTRGDRNRG